MAEEEKKLIIDEDWKREAQREKEKVAAQEAQEKKEEAGAEPKRGRRELPRGDLVGLINMLTTQALFALGLIQVKGEEDREPDLELARYNIDLLDVIEQKTKGNLTPEEQELLKNTLSDLRMGYVSVANQFSSEQ